MFLGMESKINTQEASRGRSETVCFDRTWDVARYSLSFQVFHARFLRPPLNLKFQVCHSPQHLYLSTEH